MVFECTNKLIGVCSFVDIETNLRMFPIHGSNKNSLEVLHLVSVIIYRLLNFYLFDKKIYFIYLKKNKQFPKVFVTQRYKL